MRRGWMLCTVAALASCAKRSDELPKRVSSQCEHLQIRLEQLAADFHKVLATGDSNPPVLNLSTRSWDSRVTESAWSHDELMFCVGVRALDGSEDARVSKILVRATDRYSSSAKIEDVSAAVDVMVAELAKLNAAPLRD